MNNLNDLTNAVMALLDESDVEECVKQAVLEKCLILVIDKIANKKPKPFKAKIKGNDGCNWDV